jgi:hypothetical protein
MEPEELEKLQGLQGILQPTDQREAALNSLYDSPFGLAFDGNPISPFRN